MDDPSDEQIQVDHHHHHHQQTVEEDEIFHPSPRSPTDMAQEEDVLVEENVTPFYMNSGRWRMSVAEKIHLFVF